MATAERSTLNHDEQVLGRWIALTLDSVVCSLVLNHRGRRMAWAIFIAAATILPWSSLPRLWVLAGETWALSCGLVAVPRLEELGKTRFVL